MSKKVLILTLTGQRDEIVDNIIAEKLRQYGYEVFVHNYINAGRQSVPYVKPDVVVHPFPGGEYKVDFIRKCKEWGCGVVVRRGEAGASRDSFAKMDKEQKTLIIGNWDYSPYIDLELTWGKEFTNLLAEIGYVPKEKLRVCGAFAFDAYFRPEFSRLRNHKKTILFATGWSCAEESKVDFCECGLPRELEYQRILHKQHRAGRDLWIKTIRELHNRFGNEWNFALKVRPGETTYEYEEKLGDIVKIYPQMYSASQALRNTDLLIHAGSTMAIEAHLLNIPSLNFYNINPDPMLARVSQMVNSFDELEFWISQIDINKSNINRNVYLTLRDHLYGEIDGKACERAAKYIDEFIANTKIETHIPDIWPQEVIYHKDKENIHLEKTTGWIRWLCPCCKNVYWVTPLLTMADCPYCGMMIEKTEEKLNSTESVLK